MITDLISALQALKGYAEDVQGFDDQVNDAERIFGLLTASLETLNSRLEDNGTEPSPSLKAIVDDLQGCVEDYTSVVYYIKAHPIWCRLFMHWYYKPKLEECLEAYKPALQLLAVEQTAVLMSSHQKIEKTGEMVAQILRKMENLKVPVDNGAIKRVLEGDEAAAALTTFSTAANDAPTDVAVGTCDGDLQDQSRPPETVTGATTEVDAAIARDHSDHKPDTGASVVVTAAETDKDKDKDKGTANVVKIFGANSNPEEIFAEAMRLRDCGEFQAALEMFLLYRKALLREHDKVKSVLEKLTDQIPDTKQKLEELSRKLGKGHGSAEMYKELGHANLCLGDYTSAHAWYSEEKEARTTTSDVEHEGEMSSLGIVYNNLGLVSVFRNELEHAMEYIEEAMRIFANKETSNPREFARTLTTKSLVLSEQGSYAPALTLLERAMSVVENNFWTKHPEVGYINRRFGDVYHAMGEIQKAIDALLLALEVFGENNGGKSYAAIEVHETLSILYMKLKPVDTDKAKMHHKTAFNIREEAANIAKHNLAALQRKKDHAWDAHEVLRQENDRKKQRAAERLAKRRRQRAKKRSKKRRNSNDSDGAGISTVIGYLKVPVKSKSFLKVKTLNADAEQLRAEEMAKKKASQKRKLEFKLKLKKHGGDSPVSPSKKKNKVAPGDQTSSVAPATEPPSGSSQSDDDFVLQKDAFSDDDYDSGELDWDDDYDDEDVSDSDSDGDGGGGSSRSSSRSNSSKNKKSLKGLGAAVHFSTIKRASETLLSNSELVVPSDLLLATSDLLLTTSDQLLTTSTFIGMDCKPQGMTEAEAETATGDQHTCGFELVGSRAKDDRQESFRLAL